MDYLYANSNIKKYFKGHNETYRKKFKCLKIVSFIVFSQKYRVKTSNYKLK